jgi:sugar phosphate isomerase/epimerase
MNDNSSRCGPPLSHGTQFHVSRRGFISRFSLAASAAALTAGALPRCFGAGFDSLPVVVFSKIFQELKLGFEEVAADTAAAGLDGIDCPVRPGGEIPPERAADQLPRYAGILAKHKLRLALLTTAITSPSSPRAEEILRTARKLGVRYYRLGFQEHRAGAPFERQLGEIRAQLKDLAAMNREIGVCAVFQNHSSTGKITSVGGDLNELCQIVEGFDPAEVGVAFDLGHAILVHGDGWRPFFDRLKRHLCIAYVKDAKPKEGWVPFGRGDFARAGYFEQLKRLGYKNPFSLHIEFDWTSGGREKNRTALIRALRESTLVLRRWLAEA